MSKDKSANEPEQQRSQRQEKQAEAVGGEQSWVTGDKAGAVPPPFQNQGSLAAQVSLLGNRRLRRAQRVSVARRIGRVQGNSHLQRVLAHLAEGEEAGAERASPVGLIQREEEEEAEDTIDYDAAILKAIQIVNSRSPLKADIAKVKAPEHIKVFGALELMEVALSLEISASVSAPGVSKSTDTTSVSAKTDAQASSFSLGLDQKFGSTPFAEMFSFSAAGQSTYDPAKAMKSNQRKFDGTLGFKIGAEGFEAGVNFTPISYDRSKKDEPLEGFEFLTVTLSVSKTFTKKMPAFTTLAGKQIDAALKVKVSGSIKIGPDQAKAFKAMMGYLSEAAQKEAAERAAKAIAEEEMDHFLQRLMKEIVEDEVKDIADEDARRVAKEYAEKKLAQEVEKRQLKLAAAEEASIFVRRELTASALEDLSITAIRSEAKVIVAEIARPRTAAWRAAARVMVREGVEQFSLKAVGRSIAKSLIPGPADFVLVGIQMLYMYADTLIKDMDMKELGLRIMAVRDNYVSGYVAGLHGGGASTGGGGSGNIEGAAFMLGSQEGDRQYQQEVDRNLANSTFPRAKAIAATNEIMAGKAINRSLIIARATPLLKKLILDAYKRKYSGVLDWALGEDFESSKDYENFQRYVDTFLKPGQSRVTSVRLANGVSVTLVMLDSTSDRAQRFRTIGGLNVRFSMWEVTDTCSGFVTEEGGTPLEEIFKSQEEADESSSSESKEEHIANMRSALAAGVLHASGSFNGLALSIGSAYLSNVPDDLAFQEYMRHSTVQGMTLAEAGIAVYVTVSQTFDKSATGWEDTHTVSFALVGSPAAPALKYLDLDDIPGMRPPGAHFDVPPTSSWEGQVRSVAQRDLGQRRIATLPKLI